MSSSTSRLLSAVCESCTNKLQAVAEMLLLSCCVKPVLTETIKTIQADIIHEHIRSVVTSISVISQSLISNLHMLSSKWVEISEGLQELSTVVIQLMEMISHTSYLISMNIQNCAKAKPGLVDKYSVCFSGLEIRLSCIRLKRTRIEELSPQIIIDLCSNISKHIAVITDICRTAGQNVNDESLEDQFKLSVKSVTCAAGCLIASIKSYKTCPNYTHHARVMVFCEPVLAASQALVSFATEKDFIGAEGVLSLQAREIQKTLLGTCMSIVSACIQLCKTIRDLTYDMLTSHHRERLRSCTKSIDSGSERLIKILDEYNLVKLYQDYQANFYEDGQWDRESSTKLKQNDAVTSLDSVFSNNCRISPVNTESLLPGDMVKTHTLNDNSSDQDSSPDQHTDESSTSYCSSENSNHSVASR